MTMCKEAGMPTADMQVMSIKVLSKQWTEFESPLAFTEFCSAEFQHGSIYKITEQIHHLCAALPQELPILTTNSFPVNDYQLINQLRAPPGVSASLHPEQILIYGVHAACSNSAQFMTCNQVHATRAHSIISHTDFMAFCTSIHKLNMNHQIVTWMHIRCKHRDNLQPCLPI